MTQSIASYGSMARFRNIQRLHAVGSHTIVGLSGELSDAQTLKHNLEDLVYVTHYSSYMLSRPDLLTAISAARKTSFRTTDISVHPRRSGTIWRANSTINATSSIRSGIKSSWAVCRKKDRSWDMLTCTALHTRTPRLRQAMELIWRVL